MVSNKMISIGRERTTGETYLAVFLIVLGILALCILLFSPPFFLLFAAFFMIYHRFYGGYFLLACVVGLFSIVYPPGGDYYHIYISYLDIAEIPSGGFWNYFWEYSSLKLLVRDGLFRICTNLNIPMEYIRGVVVFLCYYEVFLVFSDIVKDKAEFKNKLTVFLCFLILFFSYNIPTIFSGMRFALAVSLLVRAAFLLHLKNAVLRGTLLSFFSFLAHFAILPFIIALFLPFAIRKISKFNLVGYCICVVSICILLRRQIVMMLAFFPKVLSDILLPYLIGYYAYDFYLNSSFNYLLYVFIENSLVYPMFFLCLKFMKEERYCYFIHFSFAIICFTVLSLTTYFRYIYCFYFICAIYIFHKIDIPKIKLRYIMFFLLWSFLIFSAHMRTFVLNFQNLENSYAKSFLTTPAFMIPKIHYDYSWLERFRRPDGNSYDNHDIYQEERQYFIQPTLDEYIGRR